MNQGARAADSMHSSTTLLVESVSTRRLPVNLEPGDRWLFEHELQRSLPESRLIEMRGVRISAGGFLFQGGRILPESFAFAHLLEAWTRARRLRFLAANYLRPPTRIERDALWIADNWSAGYFHWLADTLPRLFLVRQHLKDWTLLLPHYARALPFVEPSLKPFGVDAVRYANQNEVFACRRLFVPTHAAPPGHFNDGVIQDVRRVLVTAYGGAGDAPDGRLYISRSAARRRKVSNEADVLGVLRRFGFRIMHAESCAFEEQVRAASGSRYLVSSHGAGLTNMLFMRPGSRVLELRYHGDKVSNCYFTMASALRLHYAYQTCASPDPAEPAHTADLRVDVARLERNLERLLADG
jgi:capsular polysaccharide biosynthesis protein